MILFKLINRGLLNEINGCISTGKEANVYHALSDDPTHTNIAIKIYKTSILVFKIVIGMSLEIQDLVDMQDIIRGRW